MSGAPSHTLAPWLARQLRALLAQRGHAWLLQGPPGLGQFDLALALVRAWLCDAPTPQGACAQCPSCHGIDVHTHADLAVLMPEAQMIERGWLLAEKTEKSESDDKKRKQPSKEIRIDAMREAIELAQRTSARGRGQAMLVFPAERMNHITANALLKTLEEPPGDMRFALGSEAAHLLPPTIRSRCQAHTMLWPAEDEALAWLTEQGVPAPQAAALLRAAGGLPAQALAAHRNGLDARQWAHLPRAMLQGDVGAFKDVPLPEVVSRLQKLCHDLIAVQQGAAPRFFDAAALPPKRQSLRALTGWSKQLQQAARIAEHASLNVPLATEDLVSSACQALNSHA